MSLKKDKKNTAPDKIHTDVLVIGGGMVGLSQAIALSRIGLKVGVIEKHALLETTQPAFDGRVCAIAAGSYHMLSNIGVWQHLEKHAQPIHDIRVSDGDMPVFLHYDFREVGDAPFGYIVENRHLREALQAQLENEKNIQLMESVTVESIDSQAGCVEVRLVGGQVMTAQLLIAADGKFSRTRQMLGIKEQWMKYGQTAIVATIQHTLPHDGLAQERFLPDGPFAVLPMRDHCSSLVWVEPDANIEAYIHLEDDDLVQEITQRVGDYLGKITLKGPSFTYPLSLMHAETYVKPRCVLVGDAAHGIHPIAGQGVNMGFRDVAVLAELVETHASRGLDIGSMDLLNHYQRWRRPDNITMLMVTDGLNRLFSNNWLPTRAARAMGLQAVSHMPALKRVFMRHAMGLLGDVPKLMKSA